MTSTIPEAIQVFLMPHVGAEQAMPAAELLAAIRSMGWTIAEPELREVIREMRKEGAVICSNEDGYFIPATMDEAKKFYDRMRRPGLDRLHTARLFREAARRWFDSQKPDQLPLFSDRDILSSSR